MSKRQRIIAVGGISGVGKSTLCEYVSNSNPRITYLESGDYKAKIAAEVFGKKLALLDERESKEVNGIFIKGLRENFEGENLLVGLHYGYYILRGERIQMIGLLPEDFLGEIDQHVLVYTSEEEIISRRRKTGEKKLLALDSGFVKSQLDHEASEAAKAAKGSNGELYWFRNDCGLYLSRSIFRRGISDLFEEIGRENISPHINP